MKHETIVFLVKIQLQLFIYKQDSCNTQSQLCRITKKRKKDVSDYSIVTSRYTFIRFRRLQRNVNIKVARASYTYVTVKI